VCLADGAIAFSDSDFDEPLDDDRTDQQRIPHHRGIIASAA
jgi:hypothetical protein